MFTLAISPTYVQAVEGALPGGIPVRFDATFRRLSQEEVDKIVDAARLGEMTDIEIVRQVLAGWEKVFDPNGAPLPFSAEALGTLLAIYGVPAAISAAWFKSLQGAREKN